ncbi:RNA polymerase subunit sigma-54 [Fervidobacterium thailandense]|uniref:RNA polymerase subunit sigma-54 n=1 Tax=Fervidobacterium thailandense TaxID=1008305 RepID=A0A1E3G5P7_9BACT|nr:RNA polymerase subunit sigma-54 [Fervidobacterium thailandense]
MLEAPFSLLKERFGITFELNEDIIPTAEDLHITLFRMLPVLNLSDEDEKIAEFVVYNIDSSGRLRITAEEISNIYGIDKSKASKIIQLVMDTFSEEISTLSSSIPFEHYIQPDVFIDLEHVEVRQITVKDPLLQKALEFRNETLLKIAELVRKVNEYFFKGLRKYPQVITMSYAARTLGMSVSTISRAVRDKFASTPRGTLPLRVFFGKGTNKEFVIHEIRDLLAKYPNLTDRELSVLLRSVGLNISRRTVNKYRNMLEKTGRLNE